MNSAAEICNYCQMEDCEPVLAREQLEEGAVLLRGFAAAEASLLIREVDRIAEQAAFRHWVVPGGHTMSVAMTNCGRVGWVSNRSGYRYDPMDPDTGLHWPVMPEAFLDIVEQVSPGPYLEMFSRRARLGWDTWGNEALNHVEMAGAVA